MRKYFITFSGYCEPNRLMYRGERSAFPGKEIIFSETEHFNRFCGYCEENLHDREDYADIIRSAADFMAGYEFNIGVSSCYDEVNQVTKILTEKIHMNAYAEISDPVSLFIIFNARPVKYGKNSVVIGNDTYGLAYEKHSVIVWDIGKYAGILPEDWTIWGIQQNTGRDLSKTDDVMVGLRGNELFYAFE